MKSIERDRNGRREGPRGLRRVFKHWGGRVGDRWQAQDLGVGISHYFELLRTLAWIFVAMFLFGIPSLIITFVANPDAASDAIKAGGPLGVLRLFPSPFPLTVCVSVCLSVSLSVCLSVCLSLPPTHPPSPRPPCPLRPPPALPSFIIPFPLSPCRPPAPPPFPHHPLLCLLLFLIFTLTL